MQAKDNILNASFYTLFKSYLLTSQAYFNPCSQLKLYFIPPWNCLSRAHHRCPFKLHSYLFEIPRESRNQLSRNVRKRTWKYVRIKKTQISLLIRAVWFESSLSPGNFASLTFQTAFSEDSDQTAQIAQSDLNLHWAHMSKGAFSDVMVRLIFPINEISLQREITLRLMSSLSISKGEYSSRNKDSQFFHWHVQDDSSDGIYRLHCFDKSLERIKTWWLYSLVSISFKSK